MAAPIFSKVDVERLIAMRKHVRFDDWQTNWKSRDGSLPTVKIQAFPNDAEELAEMFIERIDRRDRGEVSLIFSAKIARQTKQHSVCRYDIQNCRHSNPKWFKPKVIPSRTFHKHVYNERAVREGLPRDWDLCASLIPGETTHDFQKNRASLLRVFVEELNIEFHDRAAQAMLGGW